jgi:integrase/recombinase XerC
MNQLASLNSPTLPALVAAAGEPASAPPRTVAANIRIRHTRRAYYRAQKGFLAWCASIEVPSITAVHPVHVAAWIEASTRELAAPSVKQCPRCVTCSSRWSKARSCPIYRAHSMRGASAHRHDRANTGARSR